MGEEYCGSLGSEPFEGGASNDCSESQWAVALVGNDPVQRIGADHCHHVDRAFRKRWFVRGGSFGGKASRPVGFDHDVIDQFEPGGRSVQSDAHPLGFVRH